MLIKLRQSQLFVKGQVAAGAGDLSTGGGILLRMPRRQKPLNRVPTIRVHFIPEWAVHRGLIQSDLAKEVGVDKGTVSRWFAGSIPETPQLAALAHVLGLDDPARLFRHPDDDWLTRFFADRDEEEKERIRRTLETAFPKRVA